MNGDGANGKAWDAFWKILSLLVLPWASAMTWAVWALSVQVAEMHRDIGHLTDEYNRRLIAIESQMTPTNRFYRWEGIAMGARIDELEELHPRTVE